MTSTAGDGRPVVTRQFIVFAMMGAVGTAVQYAVLWLGVTVAHLSAPVASTAGFMLGAVANYLLNHAVTFRSHAAHGRAAPRYLAIVLSGLLLNYGLMSVFVHGAQWNYWVAQIITTGVGLCWNFAWSRLWAFRRESPDRGSSRGMN